MIRKNQVTSIKAHRWSRQSADLALPLPLEALRFLRIEGPCKLSAKLVGDKLVIKKKGNPFAWRICLQKEVI